MILLSDRKLLGLQGEKVKEFLNSMCTQEIIKMQNHQSTFAAFLTGQGRILADFIVYQKSEDFLVLDCHESQMMPLAKALYGYDLNQQIEFHDLSDTYQVYQSDQPLDNYDNENNICTPDPRHAALGFRIYSNNSVPGTDDLATYHRKRIELCIPETAYDAILGKTLPNELCFENLNGIHFEKGCYVGQELTARTKFRTQPKKRLMLLTLTQEHASLQLALNEEPKLIMRGTREIGHCFSIYGNKAIAIVRIAEAVKEGEITLDGEAVTVEKPTWADYSLS